MERQSSNFRKLTVWQKSMDLVVLIYAVTATLPKSETFGLMSQMQRAVTSIPSNIAEGSKRGTSKDFRSFLHIALGSTGELETQLEICHRLRYLPETHCIELNNQIAEISRMIKGLIIKVSA